MKIKILQENLKQSLSFLQNAIPSKPQLPILSSVYFQIENGILTLAATDLYLGVRTKTKVQTENDLKIVVPGDTFKQIIYSFEAGEVDLDLKEKALTLKSGQSKANIPIQPAEEYPDFPEIEGSTFSLDASFLLKVKDLVSFAASTDQARPVLTAVLFKFSSQGLEVVGTDGFRLALLVNPDQKVEEEFSLLVPGKALTQVFRILAQADAPKVELQVSSELKQVKFILDQTEVFVRLIDGDYPPYHKIVPESFETSLVADGESLTQELKRALIIAQDSNNIVKWELKGQEIIIKAQSASQGEYRGVIPVKSSEELDQEIAFNATYILDMLSSTKPEEVKFEMNESLKPAMIQINSEPDFKYIIMPFRMND